MMCALPVVAAGAIPMWLRRSPFSLHSVGSLRPRVTENHLPIRLLQTRGLLEALVPKRPQCYVVH